MGLVVAFLQAVTHRHRLGGGGAFIEEGGIGDFEAGEIGDNGLEIQQRLEPTLRNLRLVGRVSRVPTWVFKNGPLDNAGGQGVVVA